jgi:hypothetical protein
MDAASLEQTSTANLEETPIVRTNLPFIDGVKISMDKLKALQGKALHKEVKVDYEMMELKLQKVLLDVEALVK